MSGQFDYFIVFAEMRTGSNFLEANLNALDGVTCHGEAFNPHFIGYPNKTEILSVTQAARDADPQALISAIRQQPGILGGFRFFHNHDARVLDLALDDPRCAKIILTRNPLDSYVSWKIAKATGQWKLTDVKRRKEASAVFDADEFTDHVSQLQTFQVMLLNRLQVSGQAPFYVAYEDLQDVSVMNGLAKWLGVDSRLEGLDKSLKPQNPSPTISKVSNPDVMERALTDLDLFNLTRTPNFEPRRGPVVPSYVGAVKTPLLFMPVKGGAENAVMRWLAALDNVSADELFKKLNQKQLRQWKRAMSGHRGFSVLRHPAARAHWVYCHRILSTGPGSYGQIRDTLRTKFKLPIPKDGPDDGYSLSAHREGFESFLAFLKVNLAGQTAVRVDAEWATQSQTLNGFADFSLPDYVFREDELPKALDQLARAVGHKDPSPYTPIIEDTPYELADIYDDALEEIIADVYNRDYMMFGFGPWGANPN